MCWRPSCSVLRWRETLSRHDIGMGADPENPGQEIDSSDTVEPLFSPEKAALLSSEFFWNMFNGDGYARLSYV